MKKIFPAILTMVLLLSLIPPAYAGGLSAQQSDVPAPVAQDMSVSEPSVGAGEAGSREGDSAEPLVGQDVEVPGVDQPAISSVPIGGTTTVRVMIPDASALLAAGVAEIIVRAEMLYDGTVAKTIEVSHTIATEDANSGFVVDLENYGSFLVVATFKKGDTVHYTTAPANIVLSTNLGEEAETATSEITPFAVSDMSGIYTIGSALPGSKVIDIPRASQSNGTVVQMYTANTTPAQRFKFTRQDDGFYTITNIASGKVLDVCSGEARSGTLVWQYASNNTAAQRWEIVPTNDADNSYYLRTKLKANLYLDVQGGASANGTKLQIYQGNATSAQKFYLNKIERNIADGYYVIHTKSSNKVLDIAGGGLANNTNLQIYQANNTFAQKFQVAYDAATGYYTITSVNALKPLDVAGAGATNGTNVAIYAANNTPAQRWTIVKDGEEYRIYAACSGLVLDVQGAGASNGTNVWTYSSNNTVAQKWTFEATTLVTDKKIFTLRSALGTVLDVAGGGVADGTNIQTYAANDTQAQKFKITGVGDGYYRIECLNSGKVLGLSGTNVILSAYTNAAAQHWKPLPAGSGEGYLLLENKNGKVLDVANGNKSSGANVQVYARNNTVAQKWRLNTTAVVGTGIYKITNDLSTDKVLGIKDDAIVDGAVPQVSKDKDTVGQKFSFVKNSDGSYRIIPLGSSKPIEVKDGIIDSASGQGAVQQWTWRSTDVTGAMQNWRVEYVDSGEFRITSVLNGGTSCLEVKSGSTSGTAEVIVAQKSNSKAQRFAFTGLSSGSIYVPAPLDGIDVSSWQPSDIGNRVDYDFMIIKATGGTTYINPNHTTQANSVLAKGKKLGFYHYAAEYSGQNNALVEAQHFINNIRPYIGRAALFLDYEEELPGDDRVWITTFCNEVYRLTGVKCGIYTNGNRALFNISGLWDELGVPLWQANYPSNNTQNGYTHAFSPLVPCSIHQYTSQGKLPGYDSSIDLNVCFGSTATWDYWASRR
jgi:GH25 family lysozyme M1 (1,4-beta-N-acetylmuramidase)